MMWWAQLLAICSRLYNKINWNYCKLTDKNTLSGFSEMLLLYPTAVLLPVHMLPDQVQMAVFPPLMLERQK